MTPDPCAGQKYGQPVRVIYHPDRHPIPGADPVLQHSRSNRARRVLTGLRKTGWFHRISALSDCHDAPQDHQAIQGEPASLQRRDLPVCRSGASPPPKPGERQSGCYQDGQCRGLSDFRCGNSGLGHRIPVKRRRCHRDHQIGKVLIRRTGPAEVFKRECGEPARLENHQLIKTAGICIRDRKQRIRAITAIKRGRVIKNGIQCVIGNQEQAKIGSRSDIDRSCRPDIRFPSSKTIVAAPSACNAQFCRSDTGSAVTSPRSKTPNEKL